eukprot:scaffold2901_cov99-Skeletonema_marinoi.AAC.11
MNDNNSSPMKKRKANDGRVTADGTHDVDTSNNNDGGGFLSSWFGYFSGQWGDAASSSGPSRDENNTSQLDRMEVMMMRMEEKLATVESRCETLEAKCSSLQNMLELTKDHIERKFDSSYNTSIWIKSATRLKTDSRPKSIRYMRKWRDR